MYRNQFEMNNQYPVEYQDERFLFTPFLVGGLAGTALGLGIANNNQINNGNFGGFYPAPMPIYPVYPTPYCTHCPNQQPTYTTSNNYYY